MKAVIYARISPTKKEDTITEMAKSIETSLEMCRRRAIADENEIVDEYIDQYIKGDQKYMEDFKRMIQDAKRGKFKKIYCRRVDRFGRNLNEMIRTELDLHDLGISICFVEEGIDTSTPTGRMIMQILSNIATWKREEIRENTRRGREKLKRDIEEGRTDKRFGRKPTPLNLKEVIDLKNSGASWKRVAKIVGLSVPVIQGRLKEKGYYFDHGKIIGGKKELM